DDLFYLIGNHTNGYIDGHYGTNTLDISGFSSRQVLEVHLDREEFDHNNAGKPLLKIFNIKTLLARKEQADKITCACDTKYVDGRGGFDNSRYQDSILIPFSLSLCFYQLHVIVRPNTVIENKATKGNFFYEVPEDKGTASI